MTRYLTASDFANLALCAAERGNRQHVGTDLRRSIRETLSGLSLVERAIAIAERN